MCRAYSPLCKCEFQHDHQSKTKNCNKNLKGNSLKKCLGLPYQTYNEVRNQYRIKTRIPNHINSKTNSYHYQRIIPYEEKKWARAGPSSLKTRISLLSIQFSNLSLATVHSNLQPFNTSHHNIITLITFPYQSKSHQNNPNRPQSDNTHQ